MKVKSEVFNCDCMELMAKYPDGYFELAIVDPPYNISAMTKRGKGGRVDKDGETNKWNDKPPDKEYFNELFRISKNQIIWGANNYEGLPRTEYFAIWNKEQTVENFASLEYAWVSMGIGKPAKMFTYSIHKHNKTKGIKIHPTMKPVALYKWLLDNYAKEGDKILDTHLGSGSSRIACYDFKFDFVGCELDKNYFNLMEDRFKKHISQLSIFDIV